jgi:hypothetical protein
MPEIFVDLYKPNTCLFRGQRTFGLERLYCITNFIFHIFSKGRQIYVENNIVWYYDQREIYQSYNAYHFHMKPGHSSGCILHDNHTSMILTCYYTLDDTWMLLQHIHSHLKIEEEKSFT